MSLLLRGIIPPLATPLNTAGGLDIAALERLVEHVLAGGVHGLFLLGTTGEGPSFDLQTQADFVRAAAKIVGRRVPVLVGVTSSSLESSLELARASADAGCDAIVAAPPYYFRVGQHALAEHFERLARASPLPTVLYNMPAVTNHVIEPATVEQLLDSPKIVGLKDSSGDLEYFATVRETTRRCRAGFPLLVGPEHLLAKTLAMGGDGGVSGGANVFPELFTAVYDAAIRGDDSACHEAQQRVDQLGEIYRVGPFSIPAIIARTKVALACRGIATGATASPICPATSAEREAIAEIVARIESLPPIHPMAVATAR